jgi:hypothetical protein
MTRLEQWGVAAMVLLALLVALLVARAVGQHATNTRLVNDYCAYGARSQSQLDGCKEHVTGDEVLRSRSPAAQFATHSDVTCGDDAGDFCYRVALKRLNDEFNGP